MRLDGKVAVITGGARGIGAAIARRLASEGAVCVIADTLEERARELAGQLGGAHAVACDVTRQEDIDRLVATAVERAGGIDILVNNAAVFDMAPVLEQTRESWDRQFDINVKGLFFTLQACAARMALQGRGGKIVNLASQAGRRGEALVAAYCATKAAVISITQSAALGLTKHRINVNALAPGIIETDMWVVVDGLFAKYQDLPVGEPKRRAVAAIPWGRIGEPEDVARAALFLVSPDADYITGQTLNVDGGNVLR
jgi:NAD(P)-dependent dehydrogenase (short-subunit alcohol dehydrogenase family)